MNTAELLDELRRNILRDVSTAVSAPVDGDQLWTDDTLLRYINDAYLRFAEASACIRDNRTPEVTQLTLATGVREYDLHPSVVSVYSAVRADGVPLNLIPHRAAFGDGETIRGSARAVLPWTQANAAPLWFSLDEAAGVLTVFGTPAAEFNGLVVNLRVTRRPLAKLTLAEKHGEPEVPEQYHLGMLEWAAYLALRNHDVDLAGEMTIAIKASSHRKAFEAEVERAQQAAKTLMFAPVQFVMHNNWG